MEKYLRQIANTLVLYSYHVQNFGVINGKMGIAIFFYHYAHLTKNELYNDFADNIIDDILKATNHLPIDFENGLTGIAWGVNYLLKNKFVDGNPDDVLQDIDAKIISTHIEDQSAHSIFGHAHYLLSRMNIVNMGDNEIEFLLDQCEKKMKKHIVNTSLYSLNSVFFFLIQVDNKKTLQKLTHLKIIIQDSIYMALERKKYDCVDYKILNDILNYLTEDDSWYKLVRIKKNIIPTPINAGFETVENFVKNSWLNMLYFENKKIDNPTEESIRSFVEKKLNSLSVKDFLLNQGLAGLGLGLIRNL